MAWIGLIDHATGLVRTAAKYGEGVMFLEEIVVSVDENSPNGHGTVGNSVRTASPAGTRIFSMIHFVHHGMIVLPSIPFNQSRPCHYTRAERLSAFSCWLPKN